MKKEVVVSLTEQEARMILYLLTFYMDNILYSHKDVNDIIGDISSKIGGALYNE